MAFQCGFCGRAFNSNLAKREHELIHSNLRVQCDKCNKTYSNRANCYHHKAREHCAKDKKVGTLYSTDGKRLTCGECGSIYHSGEEDKYLSHIERHLK